MSPQEFVTIQQHEQSLIDQAQERIDAARAAVEDCPIPKRLRKAKPSDLTPGAIIWHKRSRKDGGTYWNIVDHYRINNDSCIAAGSYIADDGCVYPIEGAFIEE